MSTRTPVHVHATDPVSQAGLTTQLRWQHEIEVVDEIAPDSGVVAVVSVNVLDDNAMQLLRTLHRQGCQCTVLVIADLDDARLLEAIEAGVCALVHRNEATPGRLAQLAVKASAGEGTLPSDMLGRLLKQMTRLQRNVLSPMGLTLSGLSQREIEVLRLVADGFDTQEISEKLRFSERTIKNVLHDITSRFQLRNRSHAVAYAMREGLI